MTDPETCQHASTTVTNSRPDGSHRADGNRWNGPRSYPCLVHRNRRCLDCGHRFRTVEVPTEFMDDLAASNDPSAVRRSVAKEVFAYLTKGIES